MQDLKRDGVWFGEFKNRRKDGGSFITAARITGLKISGKQYWVSVQEDITARKRAEQDRETFLLREQEARREAETANRLKDEFLATVSHELRTPLNAILGWIRMLNSGKLDSETAARAIEVIERNARAQAQLIEDLLDISRIITGKLRLDIRPVDLAAVVAAAADAVRPAADAKDIQLDLSEDTLIGTVSGDPDRLQQVIWNLLSNAVKFTPNGGRVEVRAERAGAMAQVSVTDTGEGISPGFLPYVFDRFLQADGTLTRRHGGLGLGLAIVRHLIEMHGGTVHATSDGEGRGATFALKLPLRVSRNLEMPGPGLRIPARQRTASAAGESELAGLNVIVVDDDAETREMLTRFLDQFGAAVTACASAREAFAAIEQRSPDILISDIAMPDEDGYTFISRIRAFEHTGGRVPAIALTAHVRIEDRMRSLSAGFDMFVPKPLEMDELLAAITSLAGRKKGGQARAH